MLGEDISITLHRAPVAGEGVSTEEDTLQVTITRNATVDMLKNRIFELYDIPLLSQVLRRSLGSEPLRDSSPLACYNADALHLEIKAMRTVPVVLPVPQHGGPIQMTPEHLSQMADRLTEAFEEIAERQEAYFDEMEETEFRLNIVVREMDRRCRLCVEATAYVCELVDMAKAELRFPGMDSFIALEFAGEVLPPARPLHTVGLADDDTLFLVRPA